MHYLDNYISGSIVFSYQNTSLLGSTNSTLCYISSVLNGFGFSDIRNISSTSSFGIDSLYTYSSSLGIITTDIYCSNVVSSYVVYNTNFVYKTLPVFFLCDILFMVYTLILFFVTIVLLFKETFFKPIISAFSSIIMESEQNIFNIEDFFLLISAYCVYIFYFGSVYIPISGVVLFLFKFSKLLMLLILTAVISIPVYFLWKSGCMAFAFIKGSSNDNNIYVTSMNDTMGLVSTILRYVVQSIRWVLFFLFYFILQFFLHEIKYVLISFDTFSGLYSSGMYIFSGFSCNIMVYFVYVIARVWFEVLDFLFVMVVQLSAFIVVLFWLLGFLFSSTVPSIFEVVYYGYRKENNYTLN